MHQLSLFSHATLVAGTVDDRKPLDAESETLLQAFRSMRLSEGAHPRSIAREVSQLRAIARESALMHGPANLSGLFADLKFVACVLREPRKPIALSTGQTRLIAVQRFISFMSPLCGRKAGDELEALDALLPARRITGWHSAGTVVAGTASRRRRRGPTLDAVDLRRIVDAAGAIENGRTDRNRALVAMHCFSGLRTEEIVRLRWEALARELTPTGFYGMVISIERQGRHLRLPLPDPAARAVEALAQSSGGYIGTLSGPVFLASGSTLRPLSYRSVREILRTACQQAGLPSLESVDLRSACAHWLSTEGLSAHEVAAVLGLARVRTLDRLLQRHASLDAQRRVREVLTR